MMYQLLNQPTHMKQTRKLSFSDKIKQRKTSILYELLPPPQTITKEDIKISLALFSSIIRDFPIDGINIPEVREETREGNRMKQELIKLEPRTLCKYLREENLQNLIINRPVVYHSWDSQIQWIRETYSRHHLQNFILVGGESSSVSYPGYSVIKAARTITQEFHDEFPHLLLGGITIPTRKNEATRVLKKAQAGIEFFTTQILYEAESVKQFLLEYWQLCVTHNTLPKTIFLSFAPISTKSDIKLLQWLGVDIPKATTTYLLSGWLGIGWRSLAICQQILEEIITFLEKNSIEIAIGLNIEHVSHHNFESSFHLLERLSPLYFDTRNVKGAQASYD